MKITFTDGTFTTVAMPKHEHDVRNWTNINGETTCGLFYGVCATCGDVVFEERGHVYGEWESNGDGTHTRVCANDNTHTETKTCNGGTATCLDKAV